jgi:hypothetical protein
MDMLNQVSALISECKDYDPTLKTSLLTRIYKCIHGAPCVKLEEWKPPTTDSCCNQLDAVEYELRVKISGEEPDPDQVEELVAKRNLLIVQSVNELENDLEKCSRHLDAVGEAQLHLEKTLYELQELSEIVGIAESERQDDDNDLAAIYSSPTFRSLMDCQAELSAIASGLDQDGDCSLLVGRLFKLVPLSVSLVGEVNQRVSHYLSHIKGELKQTFLSNSVVLAVSKRKRDSMTHSLANLNEKNTAISLYEAEANVFEAINEDLVNLKADISREEMFAKNNWRKKPKLDEDLDIMRTKMQDLRKREDFVKARRSISNWCALLPELVLYHPQLNPVRDLGLAEQYPAKDYETDYEVVRQISARIWEAKRIDDGAVCILKRFETENDRAKLKHAVAIHSQFSWHPNILTLNAIVNSSDHQSVFLEYPLCKFGDLGQWRKGENYQPEKLGKLFFDAVKGLQALHGHGAAAIIHRDIKPQNLLVTESEAGLKVVLSDFDLSEFQTPLLNVTMHTTSMLPFTYSFVAPEVLLQKKHTVESDRYSLGVTFGFLLMGCPAEVCRDTEILAASSDLTVHQKDIVCGLMNADPAQRTQFSALMRNPFLRGDVECAVCADISLFGEVVMCRPDKKHGVCLKCFAKYVETESTKSLTYLRQTGGEIRCPADCDGCFPFEYMCAQAPPSVIGSYFEGKKRLADADARDEERKTVTEQVEMERKQEREITQQLQSALIENNQSSREKALEYLLTEKAMENDNYTRFCPRCRRVLQKTEGCRSMVCGHNFHGGDQQHGCGFQFDLYEAPRYKSSVADIDTMIELLSRDNITRPQLK